MLFILTALPLSAQNTSAPAPVELNEKSALPDYLAYAALNNAGLKSAFHRWKAALERIPYVRSLPDPRFNFTYFIREIETRVGPQRQKVGIMQMFPWFDKLKLRGNAASRAAQVEKHRYETLKLSLFYRVKEAYYEYYFALRKIALLRENVELLKRQDKTLQAKYRTGKASFAALIKIQVEADKLQERVRSEESRLRPIQVRLNAALNRPLHTPLNAPRELPAIGPSFSPGRLSELLQENNPALKSLDSAAEKEKINLKLAKRSFYPDFSLGIDYMITGETEMPGIADSGKDPLAVMVSIQLPLWFNKNRAAVKEAGLRYRAAINQKKEEENKLLTRLEIVISEFRDAERKMALYKNSLLPRGRQALNVIRSAFEAGSADFLDFIDSQRTLLSLELEYERAGTDYARCLAEIEMLAPLRGDARRMHPLKSPGNRYELNKRASRPPEAGNRD
jgi:outer membrane protein TolC